VGAGSARRPCRAQLTDLFTYRLPARKPVAANSKNGSPPSFPYGFINYWHRIFLEIRASAQTPTPTRASTTLFLRPLYIYPHLFTHTLLFDPLYAAERSRSETTPSLAIVFHQNLIVETIWSNIPKWLVVLRKEKQTMEYIIIKEFERELLFQSELPRVETPL
jgi:hypothetical protein